MPRKAKDTAGKMTPTDKGDNYEKFIERLSETKWDYFLINGVRRMAEEMGVELDGDDKAILTLLYHSADERQAEEKKEKEEARRRRRAPNIIKFWNDVSKMDYTDDDYILWLRDREEESINYLLNSVDTGVKKAVAVRDKFRDMSKKRQQLRQVK